MKFIKLLITVNSSEILYNKMKKNFVSRSNFTKVLDTNFNFILKLKSTRTDIFTLFFFFWFIQISAQNSELKNYTIKDNLPSNSISNILQDTVGYLWFSSDKSLVRFDGEEFKEFNVKNQPINTLKQKNDSLLVGTKNGLSIKTQNKIIHFKSKEVQSILVSEGRIFVGTPQGTLEFRKDYLQPLKTNFQIDLNTINDLKFDGDNYWIATNKALWKLDKLVKPTSLKRIETGNFTHILLDKNKVYAINNLGIFSIENNQAILKAQQPTNISDIQKINNQFWIATKDNGITVLDQDFSFGRNINKYNTLATNKINKIFQDNQQNIWLATANKGIYKIASEKIKPTKPIISFSNIDVVNQPLDSININNYNKSLSLSADKKHISFSFKTVNINEPKNVFYRYKLDDEYSSWSKKNTINYAELSSGNHVFTAQSKINNQESKPISFSFFIDKPFYEKWWFKWSAVGLLLLIISSYIFNYIKRIKRKNKEKLEKLELQNHLLSLEQKALQLQMNPHFIFNVLNGIKALGNNGKTQELNTTVSKFATLLRGVLNNSRAEEISLDEEIITLKNYIELEQQMSTIPFEYSIKTNLSLDAEEILIPPMLLQPFVENAIKHGISSKEKGNIKIDFTTKNNFLHCTIDDNGIGFEQSKKQKEKTNHQSVAVKVTQERIENQSADSKFSIKELKENNTIIGTRVWFKIPLKTDF